MADPREPYGRIFHERGRLTVNAERAKPFTIGPWEDRTDEQRELDMRGASAVAAQAVADERERIACEFRDRAGRASGAERGTWFQAADMVMGGRNA